MGGNLFGTGDEVIVGYDLVDEVDPERFRGVERLIGKQDPHGVGMGDLPGQIGGSGAAADPPLAEQRELEAGVLPAGQTDVC